MAKSDALLKDLEVPLRQSFPVCCHVGVVVAYHFLVSFLCLFSGGEKKLDSNMGINLPG